MILFEMIFFVAQGGPAESFAIVLIILLAIIAVALIFIGYTLWSAWGWGGGSGGGGGGGPSQAGRDALKDLQTLIKSLAESGKKPSEDECTKMRQLIESARSGGIPSITIDAIETQVKKLCP